MEENLNKQIREYELTNSEWKYHHLACILHSFFDIFNKEFFKAELPLIFLTIDKASKRSLGHHLRGENGVGAKHTVNINSFYLDRPLYQILKTELHELLHVEQEIKGTNGKAGYHNKAFRKRAAELGIPVDVSGVTIDYRDPFLALINKHGVDTSDIIKIAAAPADEKVKGTSKLKKWTCGCTNIRVGRKEVNIICANCGNKFKPAD